jgi:Raf kinase inhibitor-like YbhB/YbcL family protein
MRGRTLLLVVVAGLVLVGCGGSDPSAPEPSDAPRDITVTSPAFEDGKEIPESSTCTGAGTSPELHWSGVPKSAKGLALVVDDPDAPNGTFTHWNVVDIPTSTTGTDAGEPPAGGTELRGSDGSGWKPPCPPSGKHHYRFSVYALKAPLYLPISTSLDDVVKAIEDATVAWGRLTGTVAASGGNDSGGGY